MLFFSLWSIFIIHLALLAYSIGEISIIWLKDCKSYSAFMKQREVQLFFLSTPCSRRGKLMPSFSNWALAAEIMQWWGNRAMSGTPVRQILKESLVKKIPWKMAHSSLGVHINILHLFYFFRKTTLHIMNSIPKDHLQLTAHHSPLRDKVL